MVTHALQTGGAQPMLVYDQGGRDSAGGMGGYGGILIVALVLLIFLWIFSRFGREDSIIAANRGNDGIGAEAVVRLIDNKIDAGVVANADNAYKISLTEKLNAIGSAQQIQSSEMQKLFLAEQLATARTSNQERYAKNLQLETQLFMLEQFKDMGFTVPVLPNLFATQVINSRQSYRPVQIGAGTQSNASQEATDTNVG